MADPAPACLDCCCCHCAAVDALDFAFLNCYHCCPVATMTNVEELIASLREALAREGQAGGSGLAAEYGPHSVSL